MTKLWVTVDGHQLGGTLLQSDSERKGLFRSVGDMIEVEDSEAAKLVAIGLAKEVEESEDD